MSSLLFPTADALRLALASGVIPPAVARGPVAAGWGDGGELWLNPALALPAELLLALARFGVTSQAPPPGFTPTPFPCWAAPLPLRPDTHPLAGPVLVRLPGDRLARFVASVQRLRPQPVRFLPDRPFALALLPDPPAHLLDTPDLTAYHPAAADVWVRVGWQHPLPAALAVPTGSVAFVDPPGEWQLQPAPLFLDPTDVFELKVRPPLAFAGMSFVPPIAIPVTLRSHPTDAAEAVWLFDGPTDQLADLLRTADERLLARFVYAVVEADGRRRVWAKPVGRGRPPVLPEPFRGFVPHPVLSGVFLPAGRVLAPSPRPERFAALLSHGPGVMVCVEAMNGSPVVHRLLVTSFRPLADLLAYSAPPRRSLPAWHGGDTRLSFLEFRPEDQRVPSTTEPTTPVIPLAPSPPPPPESTSTWLGRLADRLIGGKRAKEQRTPPVRKVKAPSGLVILPGRSASPERDARRRQLEQAVIERPTAEVWAELATAIADGGKPADAALCWVNALWGCDPPPAEWLAAWAQAESRGKPGPRLAAALAAEIGAADSHPEVGRMVGLVRMIDAHEHELPVRAVWLARMAAARAVGGDPLALARCRDRLLARLAADGPSLDLDAPGFLRFYGAIDGDRFRAARDWLVHAREPIHKWVHSLSAGRRLGWAGLDPEPKTTAAYADLMLAWGLSRLGEQGKANEWAARAERVLERAGGQGVDPTVHAALVERFQARIRAARHGRGNTPLIEEPPPALPTDPDAAYVVAKLCERSRILCPHVTPNPYGGHDLLPLLGTDSLGVRLANLLRHPSADAVPALLADTAADPTAATLPRVVLTATDVPVAFTARTADRLMLLLPRAVELLPEAVRVNSDPHSDPRAYLQRLATRLVQVGCRLAVRFDLNGGFGAFVRFVLDAIASGDGVVKAAAAARLGDLFAALRKLGLTDLAGELAGAFADRPIGWFVLGRDEAGWALLDAARERLFVTGVSDDRERTDAAFAYVAALAHAPPRLALGRLEELFQRLGRVVTAGATARYFALTPLELIDRAVSAVVTDEFNLGPAVRRWLDDDEYVIRRRIARDLEAALTTAVRGESARG